MGHMREQCSGQSGKRFVSLAHVYNPEQKNPDFGRSQIPAPLAATCHVAGGHGRRITAGVFNLGRIAEQLRDRGRRLRWRRYIYPLPI